MRRRSLAVDRGLLRDTAGFEPPWLERQPGSRGGLGAPLTRTPGLPLFGDQARGGRICTSMSTDRFLKLVEQQPDNRLFRFSLAKALCDAGAWQEAVPHLQKCCAAQDDWMLPRILLGRALQALGQAEESRAVLGAALRLAREQGHEDPEKEILALLGE